MRVAFTAVATLALMGCNFADSGSADETDNQASATAAAPAPDDNLADSMASNDPRPLSAQDSNAMFPAPGSASGAAGGQAGELKMAAATTATGKSSATGQATAAGSASAAFPLMQAQVVLDRLGFTPGVVDGKNGMSTKNAIEGYQEANELKVTGELDEPTRRALAPHRNIAATRQVTLPAEIANMTFTKVPDEAEAQAKLDRLGYNDLMEKLAERFHTTPETLAALNGGKQQFAGGDRLIVPNVGADRLVKGSVDDADWQQTLQSLGVGSEQPKADKIVVDKSDGVLRAFDGNGKLVAQFSATMGSEHDPLPLGDWKILGTAHNPPFSYNPELFWDVSDKKGKLQLPPGPNGPVGVVWIDLSKEHYGIHGTSEPQTIGRAQSHGCIRLTNWDAARLAQMVHSGTQAHFQA
ncbi:L,D-transpeptidase family protein [Novosphingopyxis sp.]|uniref:L,D-transpeptidase family protein n=1 Tax=Novosphingopyxis sp. TaxID=2709690 RepID=UPI003B5C291B